MDLGAWVVSVVLSPKESSQSVRWLALKWPISHDPGP